MSEFISCEILIKFLRFFSSRFGANLVENVARAVLRNRTKYDVLISSNNGPMALFFAPLVSRNVSSSELTTRVN